MKIQGKVGCLSTVSVEISTFQSPDGTLQQSHRTVPQCSARSTEQPSAKPVTTVSETTVCTNGGRTLISQCNCTMMPSIYSQNEISFPKVNCGCDRYVMLSMSMTGKDIRNPFGFLLRLFHPHRGHGGVVYLSLPLERPTSSHLSFKPFTRCVPGNQSGRLRSYSGMLCGLLILVPHHFTLFEMIC